DNRGCTDVNECITGSNNCSNVATCTNQIGSYSCACNSGYVGDGINCYELSSDKLTCVDINECQRFRPCYQVCINTEGSFTCECEQGFELNNSKLTCNVSESCGIGHNCSQICTYINGSEICSCMKGYALTYGSQTESEDIDECNSNPSPYGWTCDDINECLENNPCSQNANCTNAPGSYACQCKIGYTGNGKICSDIHECLTGSNMCSSNASCMSNNGSYTCMCKPGFVGNGYTRQDVNECSTTNDCSLNAICTNTAGSHTCECKVGYSGDGKTCNYVDECTLGIHSCSNSATCNNTMGSYLCKCNQGFSGNGSTCNDINECAPETDTCSNNATCTNTIGSYMCTVHVIRDTLEAEQPATILTNDPSSAAFTILKQQVTTALTSVFTTSSSTKGSFERVDVTAFKAGSIIAEYYPIFKQNSNISPSQLANIVSTSSITIQGQPIQNATVTDFDECAKPTDNNCHSNQSCVNLPATYSCQCYQGDPYSSPSCSIACTSDYYLNGGTCAHQNNQRVCSCTDSYTGIKYNNPKNPQENVYVEGIDNKSYETANDSPGVAVTIKAKRQNNDGIQQPTAPDPIVPPSSQINTDSQPASISLTARFSIESQDQSQDTQL
ncbi:Fibrillin-1, partial [Trichoplax sp. H2]